MSDPIKFYAQVSKVQTLADGGIRVTLDLPETALMQMAEMAACKIHGVVVDVEVRAREQGDDGADREKKRKSKF